MISAGGGNWSCVWEKEYELVYLYHSSSDDLSEHWRNIHHNEHPFFKRIRKKLKNRKLRGLAIVIDDMEKRYFYAIFGVVEKEEEKEEEMR